MTAKPTTPPIVSAVMHAFDTVESLATAAEDHPHQFYNRLSNPTVAHVEARLAQLEESEGALLFSSGMAAISTLMMSLLEPGAKILVDSRIYGGAAKFFKVFSKRCQWQLTHFSSFDELQKAITEDHQVIYFESPTNPRLDLMDIEAVVQLARDFDCQSIFDATFASPHSQRPFAWGVDWVVHSATKVLNGHHDVLAGVVLGSMPALKNVMEFRSILGCNLDPNSAYLLNRGLETLPLRVERQHDTALAIAQALKELPDLVPSVLYPGLEDHPGHAIARKQMGRYGSILTLDLKSESQTLDAEALRSRACQLANGLKHFKIAPSLGGCESLVSIPSMTTHLGWTEEAMLAAGLSPGMVRLSIGLEDPQLLIADLLQSFQSLASESALLVESEPKAPQEGAE